MSKFRRAKPEKDLSSMREEWKPNNKKRKGQTQ